MRASTVNNGFNVRSFLARSVFVLLFAPIFALILPLTSLAQIDPDETAPPPIKLISKDERGRLGMGKDPKERTKVAIELLTTRISTAEKLMAVRDFDGVFRELGGFQGLLDDHLEFLIKNDNDSGRALDNFKRFEIGLRSFVPRIEAIRRELPDRFEPFVRSVGKYLRDARSKALEPLFSDTVVREPTKPN